MTWIGRADISLHRPLSDQLSSRRRRKAQQLLLAASAASVQDQLVARVSTSTTNAEKTAYSELAFYRRPRWMIPCSCTVLNSDHNSLSRGQAAYILGRRPGQA